jgi:beta-alanine degradation protein BauB
MGSARQPAVGTLRFEDEGIRITEWRFAPGAATGWHRHAYDYAVVPLLDGRLQLEHPNGSTTFADLKRGVPYGRKEGVEHDVINANDFDYAFLEIELKKMTGR